MLTDLNRHGGIGSNALLAGIGPFRLLVDAGLHPKLAGNDSLPVFSHIGDNSLDFVLVTHCHLDHLGSLPVLMRRQPQAQLLMSQPSRMLASRMMHNSCNVMTRQREELGLTELPLYTHGEVDRVDASIMPMPFDKPRTFYQHGEEIEIAFYPAGHVAGAAGIRIVYKHRRIFFTGDVLFTPQRTLPGAGFPNGECDTLVMETTRGQTARTPESDRETEVARLIDTIDHLLSHGGSVLVPVFALGRMQEVLTLVNDARAQGRLRKCPVYCSGLGMDIANTFDAISKKTGRLNFRRRVIKELKVRPLPSGLKPGCDPAGPGLYIVSSGMMVEHTPSYRVAASLLEHHRNGICFVGYCDPDTPGGKLIRTAAGHSFLFEALEYACPVRARIEKFDLSGHADREELLDFALAMNPRAIVLTHGDREARDWFFDEFAHLAGNTKVIDPVPLQTHLV